MRIILLAKGFGFVDCAPYAIVKVGVRVGSQIDLAVTEGKWKHLLGTSPMHDGWNTLAILDPANPLAEALAMEIIHEALATQQPVADLSDLTVQPTAEDLIEMGMREPDGGPKKFALDLAWDGTTREEVEAAKGKVVRDVEVKGSFAYLTI